MTSAYVTTRAAAEFLDVSTRAVRHAVHRGDLHAAFRTPNGQFRFRLTDLEAYACSSKRSARSPVVPIDGLGSTLAAAFVRLSALPADAKPDDLDEAILALLADGLGAAAVALVRLEGDVVRVERVLDHAGLGLQPGVNLGRDGTTLLTSADARVTRDMDADPCVAALPHLLGLGAFTSVPLRHTGGRPYGALCVLHRQDRRLDEREIALLTLAGRTLMQAADRATTRESAGRSGDLATVLDCLPSGVLVVDASGRAIYINASGRKMGGQALDLTRPVAEQAAAYAIRPRPAGHDGTCGPEQPILTPGETPISRALSGAVVPARQGLVRIPDMAEERVVETAAVPWRDGTGAVCGAVAIFSDVTAQVHAEQALERNERRYRALAERAMDIVGILSAEGTISYVSPSVQRVLGYTPEEVWGCSGFAFVHPDDRAVLEQAMAALVRTPGAIVQMEARVRHHDGSWRLLEVVNRNCLDDPAINGIVFNERDVTAQHQAEDQLRRSEARFRSIYEHAPIGLALGDAQGRVLMVNPTFTRIVGYDEHELWGKSFAEASSPDDATMERALFEELLVGTRDSFTLERQYIHKRGHPVWCHLAVSATRDESGAAQSVIGMLLDITDRRAAEEALRASEERLRRQFEGIPIPTYVWQRRDDDWALIDYNPAAAEYSRIRLARYLGRSAHEIYRHRPDILADFERCWAERTTIHRELPWTLLATAEQRVLLVTCVFVAPDLMMVHTEDVTERRAAEEALSSKARQQAAVAALGLQALVESRRSALFEQAVALVRQTLDVPYAAIFEVDQTSDALRMSAQAGWPAAAWAGTVGLRHASQVGYTLLVGEPVVVEDLRAETRFRPSQLLRDYGVVSGVSVPIRGPEGPLGVLGAHTTTRRHFTPDDVHFLQAIASVLGAALERVHLEETRRRVAELEEQNRLVVEADRLKYEALTTVSHELRTPLNAIAGFAELLLDDSSGALGAREREYLGTIRSSAHHLLQLTKDILDLAKIEAGKIAFYPEPTDLGALVHDVCSVLRPLHEAKHLRMDIKIDSTLGTVVVDPARLRQVLYNYLSNAIKFTPSGGRICVRAYKNDARTFRLEVQDTGIGIAAEEMDRLFTAYEQLHSGKDVSARGTGLGLALTKRLVEAQGGSVGVVRAPGGGSLFYALLPREGHAVAPPAPRRRKGDQ